MLDPYRACLKSLHYARSITAEQGIVAQNVAIVVHNDCGSDNYAVDVQDASLHGQDSLHSPANARALLRSHPPAQRLKTQPLTMEILR